MLLTPISCPAFRLYVCPVRLLSSVHRFVGSRSLLESCFGRAFTRFSCKFYPILSILFNTIHTSGPCPTLHYSLIIVAYTIFTYILSIAVRYFSFAFFLYPHSRWMMGSARQSRRAAAPASPPPLHRSRSLRIFVYHLSGSLWLRLHVQYVL